MRDAVLTTSPATSASPSAVRASSATSASPVLTATRTSSPSSTRRVAHRERRADRTLGVVLVRDRRAEDGHHRVADELLDRAAVPLELVAHARVVGLEAGADVLRIG